MAKDFRSNKAEILADFENPEKSAQGAQITNGIRSLIGGVGSDMQIQYIPLNQIDTFKDHPFHDLSKEKMDELVDNVKHNAGTLDPAIVRRKDNGRYEMISGHQRKRACELARLTEIPVIIRQLTHEQAVIQMADTNIHRDEILPSEKAFAYRMRRDAEQRQGKRSDSTSHQVGEKLSTVEKIGAAGGDSQNQVLRYIRLTNLRLEGISPDLLNMVDDKKPPFMVGVALSYLSADEQIALLNVMEKESVTPSLQQAEKLKKRSKDGGIDEATIQEILFPKAAPAWQTYSERLAQTELEEAAKREQEEAKLAERITSSTRFSLPRNRPSGNCLAGIVQRKRRRWLPSALISCKSGLKRTRIKIPSPAFWILWASWTSCCKRRDC